MKKQVSVMMGLAGLVLGVLAVGCSHENHGGTHMMGPPGKSQPMPNAVMPSQAKKPDSQNR